MNKNKANPFVAIAGITGGITVVIVTLLAVLAREQLALAPWIVAALALLGMVLGYFASRK